MQGVTYGATGSEVAVASYWMVNSTCIAFTLLPGAGSGLLVRVQVRRAAVPEGVKPCLFGAPALNLPLN